MELIEIEQRPMTQDKMRQLADKVREAAYESVESLWSAVLDVVDMDTALDTAQCFEQALASLLELRNYDKAMGMVAGLFALCGVEITAGIVACQKYPALMRMFLAETGEYLNDRDIAELMCAPGE